MTWQHSLIRPSATIREAIESLNRTARQICLISDPTGKLLGTLTDGDIRRGILSGVSFESEVAAIMNSSPVTVSQKMDSESMLEIMRNNRLHQLPLLNYDGKIIGLIEMADLIEERRPHENWVVLMAGGLGKRLRPLTETKPKPLLEIGSRPLLETILNNFVLQNFRHFYISVNYKSEQIKSYFGDGSNWGVEIRYLEEPTSLGTAGALRLIEARPDRPLIVMNGDLLTQVNFNRLLQFHAEHSSHATMCVREYDMQVPFGVVTVENNRIKAIDEKPTHRFFVNAGIYALNAAAIELIPEGLTYDMTTLFEQVIASDMSTSVFPIHEYWMDVGHLEDYQRANLEFGEHFDG